MFVDDRLRSAELAFLNAPFNKGGWLHAIGELAAATRSEVAQLCGGGSGPELAFNYFSQELADPHGHLVNPALYGPENWRINCTHRARTIQYERHYAAYREANPAGFYDDAVSDLDLPFGCQSALLLDSDGLVGLALLRTTRDGPCSPEIVADFARIARQAYRAVRVQLALGQESAELMLSGLTNRTEATLLLDRHGGLCALTEAAERLFDDAHGLQMHGARVGPALHWEAHAFGAALSRLLASNGLTGPVVHEFRFGRSERNPNGRWRGVLARLPAGRCELGFAPEFALTVKPLA